MAAWATWPDRKWPGWHHYKSKDADKYGTKSRHDIPFASMSCIMDMIAVASSHVIEGCFPDLELHGAGMHMIPPGGYLRKHLDSSVMESTGWRREYSCVLGVNPHWGGWGGRFVMDGEEPISPEFNQMILFRTGEESFHQVTDVEGTVSRCTLAVFFWSHGSVGSNPRTQAKFFHE